MHQDITSGVKSKSTKNIFQSHSWKLASAIPLPPTLPFLIIFIATDSSTSIGEYSPVTVVATNESAKRPFMRKHFLWKIFAAFNHSNSPTKFEDNIQGPAAHLPMLPRQKRLRRRREEWNYGQRGLTMVGGWMDECVSPPRQLSNCNDGSTNSCKFRWLR